MFRWWLFGLGVVLAGCVRPGATFNCDDSTQCSGGGTCEPTGFCSFVDGTCPNGSRYSDAAGNGLANTCVDGGTPVDGPPLDVPVGPICGNNVMEAGEDCDDGNMNDGDTCNSICLDCSGDQTVVVGTHCYFRINALVTQSVARADCMTRGGHLVTYDSVEEHMIGLSLMVGAPVGTYWIGLEIAADTTQSWVDGSAVTFENFTGTEPDDPVGSRCVDTTTAGAWGDEVCSRTHGYLCERVKP